MDKRDEWAAMFSGGHPALTGASGKAKPAQAATAHTIRPATEFIKGARTNIMEDVDEDGNVTLNVLGPADEDTRHHNGGKGHHTSGGEHHHAAHPAPHGPAKPAKGRVPRPADADFKPDHGKVKGPKNHVLCAVHGYVVDTEAHQVIANSIEEYKAAGLGLPKHANGGHGHAQSPDHGHGQPTHATAGHGGAAATAQPAKDSGGPAAETYADQTRQALEFGTSVLHTNMKIFREQVEGACEDFASYAVKQMAGVTGSIRAADALGGIALAGARSVDQVLGGMGQEPSGLKLSRKMADAVRKGLNGAARTAASGGDNEAGILAGVRAMPAEANAACLGLVAEALGVWGDLRDAVQASTKAAQANRRYEAIVNDLSSKIAASASKILETCGIPSQETSAAVRQEMHQNMVRNFDEIKKNFQQ